MDLISGIDIAIIMGSEGRTEAIALPLVESLVWNIKIFKTPKVNSKSHKIIITVSKQSSK